jgi:predicted enzyme related to lactoylglutathione lyase
MSESVKSVESVMNNVGCMYMLVNDQKQHIEWYEKLFNSAGTRKHGIYWDYSEEHGVNHNFKTEEWIKGEIYDMFSVSFETDCIVELYDRLKAADVELEPLQVTNDHKTAFVYTDQQGYKFQVWQSGESETQPLRDGVPALLGISALYFPVSDPTATYRWYKEVLGTAISENGQPMTRDGIEFYFIKSLEPGRRLNLPNDNGLLPKHAHDLNTPERSRVNIDVNGLEELHRRMIKGSHFVQNPIFNRDGCGRQFQLADPDGNLLEMWENHTIIERRRKGYSTDSWKDRFQVHFDWQIIDIDTFMQTAAEGVPQLTKRVQLYTNLRETDAEGLVDLLAALEEFNEQYPDRAFDSAWREWIY